MELLCHYAAIGLVRIHMKDIRARCPGGCLHFTPGVEHKEDDSECHHRLILQGVYHQVVCFSNAEMEKDL